MVTFVALASPCHGATKIAAMGRSTLRPKEHKSGLVRLAAAHTQRGIMHVQAAAPPR